MLSIQAIKNPEYYLALAVEDYYLNGGEPEGRWIGSGVGRLRLGKTVTPLQLRQLMRGFDEDGRALVQNAGWKNRQAGWDLTFSPPKSASVVWSNCGRERQLLIQQLHFRAVRRAIGYLEERVAYSRVGSGGEELQPADLVVGTFEHGTSRAQEPQIHTHALVLNIGVRPNGTTGTILSRPLYRHKMLAGALYRMELAAGLRQECGFELVPKKTWFEIKGVPEKVLDYFSSRRKEVEEKLGELGVDTASAAALAAVLTRSKKDLVPPRQELFDQWQQKCRELGFTQRHAEQLFRETTQQINVEQVVKRGLEQAIDSLEEKHSYFTENELLLETAHVVQASGITVDQFLPVVEREQVISPRLVNLGVRNEQRHYSTRKILAAEENLLRIADKLSQAPVKAIPTKALEKLLGSPLRLPDNPKVRITLRPDQADAVRHLASGKSALRIVSGLAGTGKTAMLLATRTAFESQGYQVVGVTPTHRARQEMAKGAGIDVDTLAMRLMQFEAALQPGRSSKNAERVKPVTLNPKSVVVLDETSMTDTLTFERLLRHIERSGARLLIVGDEKQLPPVGPGGAFDELTARPDVARLTYITRQREKWSRKLVHDLSKGCPDDFLRQHALRGQLTIEANREEAEKRLIEDWRRNGGAEEPHRHVIAATTNAQVDNFNGLAQQQRLATQQIDAGQSLQVGSETFYVGDRVTFQKNARKLKVFNGDLGTVVGIRDWGIIKTIAVRLDGDEPKIARKIAKRLLHEGTQFVKAVRKEYSKPYIDQETRLRIIPIRSPWSETYGDLRRAYAFTTHKLQGATIDNVYVALGDAMTDRELTYVQGSRHRESLRLYTTKNAAGEVLSELVRHPITCGDELKETKLDSSLVALMEQSRKRELATQLQIKLSNGPTLYH